MPAVTVRPGRHREVDVLSRILTQAFHPLPSARWLIDDDAVRTRCLPDYFAIFVDHALDVGHVDVVTSRSDQPVAVAVWLPGDDPGGPSDYDAQLAGVVPPERLERFLLLDALMHHAHPDGQAEFEYLAFLAVQPTAQRGGLGTSLLHHRHAELGRAGVASYLVAATSGSRDLYTRHGYQLNGDPITLPPSGPRLWPMWREPGREHFAPRQKSKVAHSQTMSRQDE